MAPNQNQQGYNKSDQELLEILQIWDNTWWVNAPIERIYCAIALHYAVFIRVIYHKGKTHQHPPNFTVCDWIYGSKSANKWGETHRLQSNVIFLFDHTENKVHTLCPDSQWILHNWNCIQYICTPSTQLKFTTPTTVTITSICAQ